VKTGVQCFRNYLKSLDSGFRRNDDHLPFSTSYDFIIENLFNLASGLFAFSGHERIALGRLTGLRNNVDYNILNDSVFLLYLSD
jgi:hypothetical protein